MNKFLRNFLWFGFEIFTIVSGWAPFRLLIRRVSSLINFNREVSVNVRGHVMRLATLDRLAALFLWKYGILERYETCLVQGLVKEGMVVLDIGANLGYYTLQMAQRVGRTGKVIAFEPDPSNFSLLTKNLKLNNYNNTVCIQKAVADKTGAGRLFYFAEHRGGHRIYDSGDNRSSFGIQTVALDDFFAKGERIDFIKMDIEGAECLALLGMKRLVQENDGLIIICELIPKLLRQSGRSPEEFFKVIVDLGFQVQFINEYQECLQTVSHQQLIRMGPSERTLNLYLTKA